MRALSDDFELAGVANTSLASERAAAAAFGLPRAFESAAGLVASPDVDVVVVTVKVAYHRELVCEALNAGKSVYCEWPLGNGLAEAMELAQLANDRKLPGVAGTQAIASPEVEYVRKIVADGYLGKVLSATYIGAGIAWGNDVPPGFAYAMDSKNGVTLLSVNGGHAISAVQSVLGRIVEVGAVLSQRRQSVRVIETGEMIPMKTPDPLVLDAVLRTPVWRSSVVQLYRGSICRPSLQYRSTLLQFRDAWSVIGCARSNCVLIQKHSTLLFTTPDQTGFALQRA